MNLVADETAPFFSKMMPVINQSLPCIQLGEKAAACFVEAADRIAKREENKPESTVFRQMNERLISLMRTDAYAVDYNPYCQPCKGAPAST